MPYIGETYDVIVVGGGHAGAEAALAPARLGLKTALLTLSIDSIAFLPCNPNIGGTAKGHLVREVDALGGQMGLNIDKTFIQSRMLNTSRGPAVHSLRAQADKKRYQNEMIQTLENQENLYIYQVEATDLSVENGTINGVITKNGALLGAKAVILCTGTYLKSKIIIGETSYFAGPSGLQPANDLSQSLLDLGIELRRFKTGTPARVHRRSIDFSVMEEQNGEEVIHPFSFMNTSLEKDDQVSCYLTYTSEKTHDIISKNIHRSPMYNGSIEGVGPRYCPSIEDKLVKFPDKSRHQIFIEPETEFGSEMYIQGLSTSLPEDVQIEFLQSVPGLEKAEIMRPGYAIEYDCINPLQLKPTLEFRKINNLYSAGQLNGTSGYEEAAGQGLLAGINASMRILGKDQVVIDRSQAYIGVLIDDLVTKGTEEPYRMMTARSEYRLELRQDNADLRLTELGRHVGLVSDQRWDMFIDRKAKIEAEKLRLKEIILTGKSDQNELMKDLGSTEIKKATSLYELIKRPELNYDKLALCDPDRQPLRQDIKDEINVQIKYEGYIVKEQIKIKQFRKLEKRLIPDNVNYLTIKGLRTEAQLKLDKLRPYNLGQASRISGVSPADINVLQIYMESRRANE
ncbi:MAG: tRNA uridine-5-carboxymethylaminomethyl(34) synthesis enzyme MnmG [Clostridium sp.]|jgi:tRNA uridine 5-carboxymethylaminomethyl modification enzyme|nr:tRNA uridine-5-carboxymethylaminomethyl(34) synthesis enzyme MnmG [Clostridium sp.]